jgi:hypothetical protein
MHVCTLTKQVTTEKFGRGPSKIIPGKTHRLTTRRPVLNGTMKTNTIDRSHSVSSSAKSAWGKSFTA